METKKDDEIVELSVGGCKYVTTRTTLTSKDGMLKAMFSGDMTPGKRYQGMYFIDRNHRAFHFVLEYLRTGKKMPPIEGGPSQEEIDAEFGYYFGDVQEVPGQRESKKRKRTDAYDDIRGSLWYKTVLPKIQTFYEDHNRISTYETVTITTRDIFYTDEMEKTKLIGRDILRILLQKTSTKADRAKIALCLCEDLDCKSTEILPNKKENLVKFTIEFHPKPKKEDPPKLYDEDLLETVAVLGPTHAETNSSDDEASGGSEEDETPVRRVKRKKDKTKVQIESDERESRVSGWQEEQDD